MADRGLLEILMKGAQVWNTWLNDSHQGMIDLSAADLSGLRLEQVNFFGAYLAGVNFNGSILTGANLAGSDLSGSQLIKSEFSNANLVNADFRGSNLCDSNFSYAELGGSIFAGANLNGANFDHSNLNGAQFYNASLKRSSFINASMIGCDFTETNLMESNLTSANLIYTKVIKSNIDGAKISKSKVYGISIWDLKGDFLDQGDLVITPSDQSPVTVDNIEIAQFIYLILNNKKIRDVINTLTSKTVLILGRFAIPERKSILDGLKDKLREFDLLPVVFDFDRPTDKDFTETINILAGISLFVIADVTNPKSSPLELQATVPNYQIPFIPIIQEGETPFAMMADLQNKYDWVLDTISYDSLDTLTEILKPHIIDPAIKMREKLRIIKAKEPIIISGKDLKAKDKQNKL